MVMQDNTNHDSQRSTKKKNRSDKITTNSSANPSLPVELILQILQFLPVLSLLKFRSACKLWLSMISSPNFVKLHLSKCSESSHFADGRLLSSSFNLPDGTLKDCSVYSLLNEPFCKPIVVDSPITIDPYMLYSIVGSCNGLICVVSGDNKVFLWNPATRKSKQLQNSDIENYYKCCEIVYGFGHDDLEDDYKVVAIFCSYHKESRTYNMKVKICSSRLDSWRSIEDFPSTIMLNTIPCQSGKLANGVLHWAATRDVRFARVERFESLDSWIIVSLDMKTEQYGEVVQPKYEKGIDNLTLGVLERSLCVLGDYRRIRADVWIMKEYGVKKSWIKLASIPYVGKPRSYEYSMPLCISTNGDIVLEGERGIVVYNSKNCRFKDIVITKFFVSCNAIIYIESLVPPNV